MPMTGAASQPGPTDPTTAPAARSLGLMDFRVCLHVPIHRLVVTLGPDPPELDEADSGSRDGESAVHDGAEVVAGTQVGSRPSEYVARAPSSPSTEPIHARLPRRLVRWLHRYQTVTWIVELLYDPVSGAHPPRSLVRELSQDRCNELRTALETLGQRASAPADHRLESYERDMLAYAYRSDENRPFRTRLVAPAQLVEIGFAQCCRYEAEGRLGEAARSGPLAGTLTSSVTDFKRSGLAVLHLAFEFKGDRIDRRPAAEGAAIASEWELIKLAKIWEGGEIVAPPFEFRTGHPLVPVGLLAEEPPFEDLPKGDAEQDSTIEVHRAGTVTKMRAQLRELTLRVLPQVGLGRLGPELAAADSGCAGGTIELLSLPHFDELCDQVGRLLTQGTPGAACEESDSLESRARLTALGGVLQGLLDFEQITEAELADVFKGAIGTDRDHLELGEDPVFHKGTVLRIEGVSDANREPWRSAVDPYLALPHAVVLHNDQLLRQALAAVDDLEDQSIDGARRRLTYIRGLMSDQVPNVFHYPQEQEVYARGAVSRELATRRGEADQRLARAEKELEAREHRRDTGTVIFGLAVTVVTAVESTHLASIDLGPTWVAAGLAAAVLAVFVWWYPRQ